jgi:hypothetical protein
MDITVAVYAHCKTPKCDGAISFGSKTIDSSEIEKVSWPDFETITITCEKCGQMASYSEKNLKYHPLQK